MLNIITREMQIKPPVIYSYTPIRIVKIEKTDHTKCWQGSRGVGTLLHCWWECKMVQSLWKTVGQLLKKLKFHLPNQAIPLLGVCTREIETCVQAYLVLLCFTLLCFPDTAFFYKWKVCVNLYWARLWAPFFKQHFLLHVSVSHFCNFLNISDFLIITFTMVICDQWTLILLLSSSWGTTYHAHIRWQT